MANEPASKPTTWIQKLSIRASHLLCLLITILVISWSSMSSDVNGLGGLFTADNIFAWHPVLMVLGMVVCFTQAMLAYRAYPFGKRMNKKIHLILQTLAVGFICLGLWAVFKFHNDSLIANLYSLHSWLGIATVVLFFQNYILGFVGFWLPYATPAQRGAYLPLHVYLGILTFFAAIITVETGITEKNAWLGCSYSITEVDTNPASHYYMIPSGCKVSNWLGIFILLLAITAGVAVMDLGVGKKSTKDLIEEEPQVSSGPVDGNGNPLTKELLP